MKNRLIIFITVSLMATFLLACRDEKSEPPQDDEVNYRVYMRDFVKNINKLRPDYNGLLFQ